MVFTNAGLVKVYCHIHSHMSAFVLVFSHPFYATTNDEGRYRIDALALRLAGESDIDAALLHQLLRQRIGFLSNQRMDAGGIDHLIRHHLAE